VKGGRHARRPKYWEETRQNGEFCSSVLKPAGRFLAISLLARMS
jgi:hypothetical protein